MPGMNSGLSDTNATLVAAFRAALLHQGLARFPVACGRPARLCGRRLNRTAGGRACVRPDGNRLSRRAGRFGGPSARGWSFGRLFRFGLHCCRFGFYRAFRALVRDNHRGVKDFFRVFVLLEV